MRTLHAEMQLLRRAEAAVMRSVRDGGRWSLEGKEEEEVVVEVVGGGGGGCWR